MVSFKEKFDKFMSQFDDDFQLPKYTEYLVGYNATMDCIVYRRVEDPQGNAIFWEHAVSAEDLKFLSKGQLRQILDGKFNADLKNLLASNKT